MGRPRLCLGGLHGSNRAVDPALRALLLCLLLYGLLLRRCCRLCCGFCCCRLCRCRCLGLFLDCRCGCGRGCLCCGCHLLRHHSRLLRLLIYHTLCLLSSWLFRCMVVHLHLRGLGLRLDRMVGSGSCCRPLAALLRAGAAASRAGALSLLGLSSLTGAVASRSAAAAAIVRDNDDLFLLYRVDARCRRLRLCIRRGRSLSESVANQLFCTVIDEALVRCDPF